MGYHVRRCKGWCCGITGRSEYADIKVNWDWVMRACFLFLSWWCNDFVSLEVLELMRT
jgi:hypothetical protein